MKLPAKFPSDLQIARKTTLKPIPDVAAGMGIGPHLLESYGGVVAKIKLETVEELSDRPLAKYVVVSAVTPTPLGEGKTTTTVSLGQAFSNIGKRATVTVRQPAMGPTFGIKGGAAGGGTARSCQWRCSTCTSPATTTRSPPPTTCSPP
jgi:formate--tetrahydrofolate ligase